MITRKINFVRIHFNGFNIFANIIIREGDYFFSERYRVTAFNWEVARQEATC